MRKKEEEAWVRKWEQQALCSKFTDLQNNLSYLDAIAIYSGLFMFMLLCFMIKKTQNNKKNNSTFTTVA